MQKQKIKSVQYYLHLHDALDELYLPYKFDLSLFENIENPELKEHIERVGKVFFDKDNK